jgi:Na+/proline symporter
VQAAQLTFEDFFMADLAMEPLKIVGFEGVFGSFFMIFILLPIAYFLPGPEGLGLHEDTLDTFAMIKSSKGLQVGFVMLAMLAMFSCSAVCLLNVCASW